MGLKRYRLWRVFMWLNIAATIALVAIWIASCRWSYWISPRNPLSGDGRVLLTRGACVYTKFEWKGLLDGLAESRVLIERELFWFPAFENVSNTSFDDFWIAIPVWMFAIPTLAGAAVGFWRAREAIPGWICRGCWYSLEGLEATTACPECGRARSK